MEYTQCYTLALVANQLPVLGCTATYPPYVPVPPFQLRSCPFVEEASGRLHNLRVFAQEKRPLSCEPYLEMELPQLKKMVLLKC